MTTNKPKKSKSAVTPMSVQEFKMWLKGLSDFQEPDWIPNKAQWEHIRLLINSLSDVGMPTNQRQQPQPQMRQPMNPDMDETVGGAEYATAQPVQKRFLGESPASRPTGERDELGQAILPASLGSKSEFAF